MPVAGHHVPLGPAPVALSIFEVALADRRVPLGPAPVALSIFEVALPDRRVPLGPAPPVNHGAAPVRDFHHVLHALFDGSQFVNVDCRRRPELARERQARRLRVDGNDLPRAEPARESRRVQTESAGAC